MTTHSYIADIRACATDEQGFVYITFGALRLSIELSDRGRRELAAAILVGGPEREVYAAADIVPLTLPKGVRELNGDTLNARREER